MAFSYLQQHDSYFGGMHRQAAKEAEMQYKQQRQALVAEQLAQCDADEYGDDILATMHEQELKCLPCVASIDIQTEIEWYMRPYLLDFLIEAHAAFGLTEDSLFLAVSILDRYCSKRVVYRKHYQLVGCTALLIAAKYNECSKKVPHVKELTNMCCGLYEENMFIQMERHIMMTLDWHIGAPTVEGFLSAALADAPQDVEVEHMSLYILGIALFHRDLVAKRPSELACASLALARIILNRPELHHCHWASQFNSETLVSLSHQLHRPSSILHQKFRSSQLSRVSSTLEDFLARHTAIAQSAVMIEAPLTPPADAQSPADDRLAAEPPSMCTPIKGQHPTFVNGCLTPPITPDIDSFGGFPRAAAGYAVAGTPTPGHYGHSASQYNAPAIYVHPAM